MRRFAPLLDTCLAPNPVEERQQNKQILRWSKMPFSPNIQRCFRGDTSVERGSRGHCAPHVPGRRQLVCFNSVKHPCGSGAK